ncbi:MAG TPA: LysR family transcriptional regulator [Acetobacteraceae bacterium]|jgi:DNA-binding transcriptional LysR family regulator|nr:LysR family transcriptional regulator [Acetobacteraceae bacterium]
MPPTQAAGRRATPAPRRINLHAAILRYLVEIARLGSIRRASARLNVASSAINRQVLRLERDLGTRIFDRLPSGMRLTPAGELLLQHVRGTLQDFDKLLAEMDGLQGIRSGQVTLAALDSLLAGIVPRALEEVSRRYPVVTFTALAAPPAAVLTAVAAGEVEIGLTFVMPTTLPLQLVASTPAPLGCVMAADHPLAARNNLTLAELEPYPVTFQSDSLPAPTDADGAFTAFRNRATARFTSNSIEFQRGILRSGLAVACLTRLGFQRELASGALVWVPLASPQLRQLRIGLYIPQRRTLPPAANVVVSILTRQLQQLAEES